MRRAARTDGNHGLIADAFKAAGCAVESLHDVGRGVPDLLVSVPGRTFVVEIKDPAQPPSKRRLTPDEKRWHEAWKDRVHIVETVEQALTLVAYYRGRLVRA